ncbi:hypothetical protein D5F01_LYC25346 [Larimichthys crocea]|uniref:Uncharacterized protein n=1 Tax=Larimichthys crocea TaxID=215358 RepID=A0A644EXM6_LARCR|nr:hypothetical protein D5F01_LYC25346 [Larimichthys crocea]
MAHVPPSSLHTSLGSWAPQSLSPPGGQRGLIILTLHTHAHKHTQRNQEEGPDMAHVPPSSLHTSLGKLGSTEPLSSWRSEGPDHTHTTHARTHKHTQRNQEEGPDMAHVPPSSLHTSLGKLGSTEPLSSWSSLHTSLGNWAPQSLSPPGGQRGLIYTTHARTHKHTQRNQEEGPDMAHVPPSSLHTSLGKLGSTEPLSSWRSEGPDHTHTTHARTHKHTQRNQEEGPDMAHVPPSSLHTSLGKLGSTEPLSSWRSEGPDHTHTTHARTHKHTQRNQEEGPDMAHVPPSSLHTSLGKLGSTEPLSSWRSEGPDHTHTTHARTHKHTQRNQEEGPDMAHVPPSSLHTSLGKLGSTEPLSSWRSEGPDHTHTTHARTHKHTQRNQEEGPDMAHVPPTQPAHIPGQTGLHRASLLLEVRGA